MFKNQVEIFNEKVRKRFDIYNGLFLNLPYNRGESIGIILPTLFSACKNGLDLALSPIEILDGFFENYSEEQKLNVFFRIVQYIERQIVLFDSVEDAAYPDIISAKKLNGVEEFLQLANKEARYPDVLEKLNQFKLRLVLTAHPTQFYQPDILDIIQQLRTNVAQNDINKIDQLIQQLGLTSLINAQKPTPLDEAKNIIYFLRNIYYDAIGNFNSQLKGQLGMDKFENNGLIQIGFWPGGDRDGNPFVDFRTTIKVTDELRMTLMKCYYKDLKELSRLLTFKKTKPILDDLRHKIYESMFAEDKFVSYEEIIRELNKLRQLLEKDYSNIYRTELELFTDKVNIFKTHFAQLDIRQDHSKHDAIINQCIDSKPEYFTNINPSVSNTYIDQLLNSGFQISSDMFEDAVLKDTIDNIKNLKNIQSKNGEDACCRYIISNSEDVYAVSYVYLLFKWCGYKDEEIHFDIIPLFETMKGMAESSNIMETLINMPWYRTHLKRRKDIQTIMLGYSDGTKDGGYFKANWSIYKTKEELSKLFKKYDIDVVYFDGRGGPPARGGGKTHRFYAALGNEISNDQIQLTIQGQTISSTYGTAAQFIHNCEQMITAALSNEIYSKNIGSLEYQLIEEISELSFDKYNALKQHPMFIPYLEEMSTLKYYANANIGSRPGKRGNKKELTLSDLRAISFVGSWSQLKQNVPGYFGLGTALKLLKDQGKLAQLKALYNQVPFVKALFLNSMMSLSKTNFKLTNYMKKSDKFSDYWQLLYDEYDLSKKMLIEVSGLSELMEDEQISKMSVAIRESIVLPLLVIQQYALQKVQDNVDNIEVYQKLITRSLYGNINASRNSA